MKRHCTPKYGNPIPPTRMQLYFLVCHVAIIDTGWGGCRHYQVGFCEITFSCAILHFGYCHFGNRKSRKVAEIEDSHLVRIAINTDKTVLQWQLPFVLHTHSLVPYSNYRFHFVCDA